MHCTRKMSNTLAVKNETRPVAKTVDESWLNVGRILGYPDSWMSYLKDTLASEGKSYQWEKVENPRTDTESKSEQILLVGLQTSEKTISRDLLSAEQSNSPVRVIFTAKPPLVSGHSSSGSTDMEFQRILDEGRRRLGEIESHAKKLGVPVTGEFIWAESSKDILRERNAEVVYDETE